MKKILTFLNDHDGISARDYIMLIFTSSFLIFIFIAFYKALKGEDVSQLLHIIESMDTVVVTIVGGVFGITAVEKWRDRTDENNDSQGTI